MFCFDRINTLEIGGADEEVAEEDLFGDAEGLKGDRTVAFRWD